MTSNCCEKFSLASWMATSTAAHSRPVETPKLRINNFRLDSSDASDEPLDMGSGTRGAGKVLKRSTHWSRKGPGLAVASRRIMATRTCCCSCPGSSATFSSVPWGRLRARKRKKSLSDVRSAHASSTQGGLGTRAPCCCGDATGRPRAGAGTYPHVGCDRGGPPLYGLARLLWEGAPTILPVPSRISLRMAPFK